MATFRDHPPEVSTMHKNDIYDPPVVHTTNQQKTSLLLWGRMKTHPTTTTTTTASSGTQKKSSTTQSTNSTGWNRKYNDDSNNNNPSSKTIIKVINRSNDKTDKKTKTTRTIHPALLFLEPPVQHEISQQQQQQRLSHNSVTNTIPRIPTRVGRLAQSFSTVLTTTKSEGWKEDDYDPDNTQTTMTKTMMIDMDQLLIACHQFEQAMMDVEQKLSARDLRNNIAKVESLYHNIPKIITNNNNNKSSLSEKNYHNMEAILRYEKEQNVHQYEETNNNNDLTQQHLSSSSPPKLIALNEQSCAMGLLWIRRSLQFQYHLFHSLLQDMDATTATMAAYEQTLQPYHSWALQKIYNMAVKSATPSNQIWLARLGGYEQSEDPNSHSMDNTAVTSSSSSSSSTPIYTKNDAEQATREDLQLLLQIWGPLIQEWERIFTKLNLEDQRRV
jgi:hypothetical protein